MNDIVPLFPPIRGSAEGDNYLFQSVVDGNEATDVSDK